MCMCVCMCVRERGALESHHIHHIPLLEFYLFCILFILFVHICHSHSLYCIEIREEIAEDREETAEIIVISAGPHQDQKFSYLCRQNAKPKIDTVDEGKNEQIK